MYEIYCEFHKNVIEVNVTKDTNVDQNRLTNKIKKKDLNINTVLQMLFLWLLDKHFRAISKALRSVFWQYITRGKPALWARGGLLVKYLLL